MKKLFLASLLATMALGILSGCGGTAEKPAPVSETALPEETTAKEETTAVTADPKQELKYAIYIDPATASEGRDTMTYLGHSTIKIKTKSGYVIYIDPFAEGDYSEPADLLLVTHQHGDHNLIDKVTMKENGTILQNMDMIQDNKFLTKEVDGINIEAVPASNENHVYGECCGYILTFDGITFYHAGDTSMIDDMKSLADKNITYALLPCDGQYNMDPKEATQVADLINAKYSIPIHTSLPGEPYNYENLVNFTPDSRLFVEHGKTIQLLG